jgi:hypothetical protein
MHCVRIFFFFYYLCLIRYFSKSKAKPIHKEEVSSEITSNKKGIAHFSNIFTTILLFLEDDTKPTNTASPIATANKKKGKKRRSKMQKEDKSVDLSQLMSPRPETKVLS